MVEINWATYWIMIIGVAVIAFASGYTVGVIEGYKKAKRNG